MTENKRYVVRSMFGKIFIEDDIKRVGVLIGYEEDGKKDNIVKVTNVLNQLNDENEELKQFIEKVFVLFDKEITRNEEAIEWGKEVGADSGSVGFYNHMLKRLKKELKE